MPQGYQVASFVRIASYFRTVLAPHVSLKLIDRRRLWPADHIERNGLMRVATKAANFEIEIPSVQGITQCRRGLRWATEAEHALVPSLARKPIGLLKSFIGPLSRCTDGRAVNQLPGLGGHPA